MTRRFVLRPKTVGLRSTAVLFAAASLALLYSATHGPTEYRVLLLVLAVLALGVVGLALTALVGRPARELLVTDKAIIVANVAIRFDEIRIVDEDPRYFNVRSVSQRLAIAKTDLQPADYAELVALVKQRFNAQVGA